MTEKIIYIVLAVFLDGLAGLSGGLLPAAFVHKHIASLLAFAAGTLTGAAFLDMLPEALRYANTTTTTVMLACLGGFVAFYIVESFLGSHATGQGGHKHNAIGPMILVGDAIHNATDGVALAAAFMTDTKTGIATTLAVLVHELPQEIGDFAILVSHGYSRKRALFWLFLVQFSALIGALGALWVASLTTAATPILLAVSAGGFIYIAAADLLPELQRQKPNGGALTKLLSFCGGLLIIAAMQTFIK